MSGVRAEASRFSPLFPLSVFLFLPSGEGREHVHYVDVRLDEHGGAKDALSTIWIETHGT